MTGNRNLGLACHLLSFAGFVVPFGNIVGPLVLWLVKRNDDPLVEHHGKESVNFQISMTIATFAIILVLALVTIAVPSELMVIGMIFGIVAVQIFEIVWVVKASIAASHGNPYRYPLALRLVR